MQLDLFNPKTKTGELFVFPLDRRNALVRKTAFDLRSKEFHQAKRFWQRHVAEIRKELASKRVRPEQVQHEIEAYTRAVSHELNLQRVLRAQPDGAA
ncbi:MULTISPECIES: DUF6074 family protein [unclassified Phyllobacterium]|uniref:DUF6074 family protein n=1 Tax=unclassified Phyllobacterium TaxID=2638441 RepID=UPI003012C81F